MDTVARNLLDMETKPDGYYAGQRKDMLGNIPRDIRRMLEVGCAEGVFSSQLKAQIGMETWGIEMNPAAAARAEARLDRVIAGKAEEVLDQLPDAYFDCIVCNDVLEHIE
jgi:2-polyprenyl-3-methyl-5-hydroxy-6-metoxy-1,4-benzoquinol methylase